MSDFTLDEKEKAFCVALARKSIGHYLKHGSCIELSDAELKEVPKKLFENRSCFVTLTIGGQLRGCIGHLVAIQHLYNDIIDNSAASAFSDPRFYPLTKDEFTKTKVEVSILTEPEELSFDGPSNLLAKIVPKKDGLIITMGSRSATFLPSVWDDLPKKEDFLSQLCQKAGLKGDAWKMPNLRVQRYYSLKAAE